MSIFNQKPIRVANVMKILNNSRRTLFECSMYTYRNKLNPFAIELNTL